MEKRFDEELYDEDSYGEKSSDEYFYDKKMMKMRNLIVEGRLRRGKEGASI